MIFIKNNVRNLNCKLQRNRIDILNKAIDTQWQTHHLRYERIYVIKKKKNLLLMTIYDCLPTIDILYYIVYTLFKLVNLLI